MSFKCDNCNTPQETGVAPIMVVTHRRSFVPPPGSQIVKEARACKPCAADLVVKGVVEMEPIRNEAYFESVALAGGDRPGQWR